MVAVESVLPGDAAYRKELPGGLAVRWSTPEDRPGVALTSALALGLPEGFESEFFIRIPERLACDDYWFGDSRGWAICVATTGPRKFPCGRALDDGVTEEEPYTASIRAQAGDAPEPVLAVVSYSAMQWRIEGHPVKAVKHTIVACRPGFRARDGTEVMKHLFEMMMSRMKMTGVTFTACSGIPNYYRRHGYELSIRYGPGFSSFPCDLPPTVQGDDQVTVRLANVGDLNVLIEYDRRNSDMSQLCASVSDEMLRQEYEWALGVRKPGWEDLGHRHVPAYVLEKDGKILAGIMFYGYAHVERPEDTKVIVRRVVYDQSLNVWDLARQVLVYATEAVQQMAEEELFFQSKLIGGQEADEAALREQAGKAQVPKLEWHVSEDHPLATILLQSGAIRKHAKSSSYLFSSDWWIAIPDLPTFFANLVPVVTKRILAAAPFLGAGYSSTLRIATYESAYPGAVLTVSTANGVQVKEQIWSRDQIRYGPGSSEHLPTVLAPRGALTQLLMGYRSLDELRIAFPDLSAIDEAAILLKVLFPKVEKSIMYTYAW